MECVENADPDGRSGVMGAGRVFHWNANSYFPDEHISRLLEGWRSTTPSRSLSSQPTTPRIVSMGKATKALKEFIESIPDSKLVGFSAGAGTIYKTTEFRLDMQGVSTLYPAQNLGSCRFAPTLTNGLTTR